ncbi:MAG: ABC transporter substrate-binding protein [Bradyrhizobiaceae bacterium]|nr:ABC transporter substrate-binding protein [Bradyrhizobiaceae bacterium]
MKGRLLRTEGRSSKIAGLSRRQFVRLAGIGAGGLALGHGMSRALAQTAVIKVGYIAPQTGALASFGEPNPFVLNLIRKTLEGGVSIGGTKYQVQILDRDTQSDPVRAGQLARTLINSDQVDFVLTTSTPETVNPVADTCEAAGVPCLSTGMPWEPWYFGRGAKPGEPSPFKWTYHFGFGTENFSKAYLSQWSGPVATNKKVAFLMPNDADGNALRVIFKPILEKAGYNVIDPGPYENGTTDYSAQITQFKAQQCEIFTTGPIPPDFAVFWRQAAQQGYTRMVKIAQIAKTGLFPSQVEALGSLGPKLATVAFWHPTFPYKSSLTGLSSQQLAAEYEKATGKQWNQMLGTNVALFDAGIAALKSSSDPRNKQALVKALSSLQVTTPVGNLAWGKGPVPNVVPMIFVGAQWVKAAPGSKFGIDLVVTDNADDPNVPVGSKLAAYNG